MPEGNMRQRGKTGPSNDFAGLNSSAYRTELMKKARVALLYPAPILAFVKLSKLLIFLVAPSGIEPELSALRGRRVNQLHHGARKDAG
jgi:hypothetical protein